MLGQWSAITADLGPYIRPRFQCTSSFLFNYKTRFCADKHTVTLAHACADVKTRELKLKEL